MNRRTIQFMATFHGKPVLVDCDIPIGSTGAVGTVAGMGIASVTRLAVGTYKVKFQDTFNKYLGTFAEIWSPNSGSNVAVTAINPTTVYTITVVGTTTTAGWITAGVPVGVTPAVGVTFLCAATTTGTGQCQIPSVSGLAHIEVVGNPNVMVNPAGGAGIGYVVVQTLGATDASTTTLIPKDPASGSTLSLAFYFSDSSNVINNNG